MKTLVISLVRSNSMETKQKGNLPRKCACTSEQTYKELLGRAPQRTTRHCIPEIFNLGIGTVMSSWTSPYQRPLVQQNTGTYLNEVTVPMNVWPGQIHSPIIILTFQWSFCLLPSFLFDDPWFPATVSGDINQVFLPSTYWHVSDTKCGLKGPVTQNSL